MEGQQSQAAFPQNGRSVADDEAKRSQEEQMKRDLISTVLDTAARERLSRIALVSPQRSQQVEGVILRMAQAGQLRGRVTEEQFIQLLDQMEEAQGNITTKRSHILYQRRRDPEDDFDI